MRCEEVREALLVPPDQFEYRTALREHTAGCRQCSEYQEFQERLDAALRRTLVVEVPQSLQAVLLARVLTEAGQARRATPSTPRWVGPVALVAYGLALALAMAAGTVVDGGGRLFLQALEGLYVIAFTLENLISSPAVWVLDWLVDYLVGLWYWVPGLVGLWLLSRTIDRFPALR